MGTNKLNVLQLMLLFLVGVALCQNDTDEVSGIYIVTLKQAPSAHLFFNELSQNHRIGLKKHPHSTKSNTFHKLR